MIRSAAERLRPTALMLLSAAGVGSVTITNGGSGYTSAPTVTFTGGGGGGGAAAAAELKSVGYDQQDNLYLGAPDAVRQATPDRDSGRMTRQPPRPAPAWTAAARSGIMRPC